MIEKNCATCKDGYMTDKPGGRSVVFCRPCFEKTGLPLWSEHELITMGRRAGIEEAKQTCIESHAEWTHFAAVESNAGSDPAKWDFYANAAAELSRRIESKNGQG